MPCEEYRKVAVRLAFCSLWGFPILYIRWSGGWSLRIADRVVFCWSGGWSGAVYDVIIALQEVQSLHEGFVPDLQRLKPFAQPLGHCEQVVNNRCNRQAPVAFPYFCRLFERLRVPYMRHWLNYTFSKTPAASNLSISFAIASLMAKGTVRG